MPQASVTRHPGAGENPTSTSSRAVTADEPGGLVQKRITLDKPLVHDGPGLLIRNSLGSLVEDVSDVRGFEVAGDDVGLALS
ncbi:hypothetical protein ACGFN1_13650, partial [Streptomyces sp. NPDC048685]|uniref:hypothetical protein n=1 Tax=Streptomyces sp. NPDC048685 TaxID=3365584 RepID=UPI0037136E5D